MTTATATLPNPATTPQAARTPHRHDAIIEALGPLSDQIAALERRIDVTIDLIPEKEQKTMDLFQYDNEVTETFCDLHHKMELLIARIRENRAEELGRAAAGIVDTTDDQPADLGAAMELARNELDIETLDTSGPDAHDIPTWKLRKAIEIAYRTGRRALAQPTVPAAA